MKNVSNTISDDQLDKVSGGKRIDKYNFYDIESKSQKAGIEIEGNKVVKSWGLDTLNERDKAQIPDNIKLIIDKRKTF